MPEVSEERSVPLSRVEKIAGVLLSLWVLFFTACFTFLHIIERSMTLKDSLYLCLHACFLLIGAWCLKGSVADEERRRERESESP